MRSLHKAWLGLIALYAIPTLLLSVRHFWYDELFTFHMSQLPSNAAVWQALKGGADLNPPLFYAITRAFQAVFGNGEVATRLPAMLGFLVMSACLYRFTSTPIAALIPWCSGAYPYSAEARPYGLMLGFAGLALVFWQRRNNARALAGFSLALACALLCHCYAVFLLVPFVLAEVARRRFDWPVWIALCLPALCVLTYLPLVANTKPYIYNNFFFHVPWSMLLTVHRYYLAPLMLPLALIGILLAFPQFRPEPSAESKPQEWIVSAGFALIPLLTVLFAKAASGQYFPRYGILGIIGFSLLLTQFLNWRQTPPRALAIATAILACCFAFRSAAWIVTAAFPAETSSETTALRNMQRNQPQLEVLPELPIVAASGIEFFELDHYAPQKTVSRLYYLIDRDTSLKYTQTDIFASGFPLMARWFHFRAHLANYDDFLRAHPHFLVYGPYFFANDWLLKRLIDDNFEVRLLSDRQSPYGDNLLVEVRQADRNARVDAK